MDQPPNNQPSDHDLLIRLDTKLEGVSKQIQSVRDDTIDRIADLQRDKLESKEFEKYCETTEKELTRIESERKERDGDIEKRMRWENASCTWPSESCSSSRQF